MSIPIVHIYTMSPCLYHESLPIKPRAESVKMCDHSLFYDSKHHILPFERDGAVRISFTKDELVTLGIHEWNTTVFVEHTVNKYKVKEKRFMISHKYDKFLQHKEIILTDNFSMKVWLSVKLPKASLEDISHMVNYWDWFPVFQQSLEWGTSSSNVVKEFQ